MHKLRLTAFVEAFIPAVLLGGTMFLCLDCFMDNEVLPKRYYFLSGVIIWVLVTALYYRGKLLIPINYLTISFFLLAGYILFREFSNPSVIGKWYVVGIFVLFVLCLNLSERAIRYIDPIITGLCIFQGIYGLVEFIEYADINRIYSESPIHGSFDNPAGFACCIAMGYPFCLFYLHKSNESKWFGILGFCVIILGVILSESRTGMLMLVAVTILFYGIKYKQQLYRFQKTIIPVFICILIILSVLLFYYKQGSAMGRLAIWQNTLSLISKNPIFGGGSGHFIANYMPCQAAYFADYPDCRYAWFASNVYHPFNEYLLLWTEYGLVGLGLLAFLFIALLKYAPKDSSYFLICISVGIGALFSYISWYPYVWCVMAYALARLSRQISGYKNIAVQGLYTAIPAVVVFLGCIWHLYKDIGFEYHWKDIAAKSLAGNSKEMMPCYEKLCAQWNGNPFFLYNYGAELNYIEEYEQSLKIMDICRKYLNSYNVQIMQADNCFHLNKWHEAKTYYATAANMCPNRFVPLAGLLDVYIKTFDTISADSIAQKILSKEVEIHSNITAEIINKAKKYLE